MTSPNFKKIIRTKRLLEESGHTSIIGALEELIKRKNVLPRPLSKRKLESYRRAQSVAQEARFQAQSARYGNQAILADHVIYWMRSTGNVKYSRPNLPNV